MKTQPISIPYFSLSPNSLTLYNRIEGITASERQIESYNNLEDNKNKYNELSNHSIKRLRKAISYLLFITNEKQIKGKMQVTKVQDFETNYESGPVYSDKVRFKLAFITLTLPAKQIHSDEEIKSKLLNQFLIELKTKFQVLDYIWKAEKQENGNIHFHILINRYIHHEKIKTIWNRILEKLGYISAYQLKQQDYFKNSFRLSENPKDKRTEAAQRKAYEKSKEENWTKPNSTDIHALYKVKNIAAYITKYIAKGVTKTDRTKEIDSLRKDILRLNSLLIQTDTKILFDDLPKTIIDLHRADMVNIKTQIQSKEIRLESLLSLGITGRIWGQSSSLSKLKNFTDCQPWESVPEIHEVETKCFKKIVIPVGQSKIYSYIIDIQKFEILKNLLNSHLLTLSG